MQKAKITTLVTILLSLATVLASFLVPVPQGIHAFDFYIDLTLSVAAVVLYAGGSITIFQGFGAFTSNLRKAYTIIFIGMTLWGIAYLQLPIIVAFNKINDSLFIAFTAVPFIVASLLTFTGTWMLAKLFNLKNWTMNWFLVLAVVIASVVLVVLVPHTPSISAETDFDAANALIIFASAFLVFGAYHVLLIKRQASVTFTDALAWLFLSILIPPTVGGVGSTVVVLIWPGPASDQPSLLLAIVSSFIAAGMFLRSAYSFSQIVESKDVQGQFVARDFFGKPLHPKTNNRISSVDIVVYAATLVSTHTAIDNLLDPVRFITAKLQPNTPLPFPPDTEETLRQVYLKIEQYLLTQETIRKFTKEGLRQDVAQKLLLTPQSTTTFWNKLP